MPEAAARRDRPGSLLTLLLPLLIGLGALAAIELGGTMTWLLVSCSRRRRFSPAWCC